MQLVKMKAKKQDKTGKQEMIGAQPHTMSSTSIYFIRTVESIQQENTGLMPVSVKNPFGSRVMKMFWN